MKLPIQVSKSVQLRNPNLYGHGHPQTTADPLGIVATVPQGTTMLITAQRDSAERLLNKTEQAYLAWLRCLGDDWIGVQCLKFQLAEHCWYTPDFVAIDRNGMRAIDVKGMWKGAKGPHVEDDAAVKIKVAARLYASWCRFVLAWRDGEVWQHREINP